MILPSSQLQFVVVSVLLLGPGLVHSLPFHYGFFPVTYLWFSVNIVVEFLFTLG